jgi:hypothetical protein
MKIMFTICKSIKAGFSWDTVHGLWRDKNRVAASALLHVLCFVAVSCAYTEERMTRPDGSTYTAKNMWMGGDHMAQTSSGAKYASTNTASFRDLVTGATSAIGLVAYGKAAAAAEVTKQVTTKEATKLGIIESTNAAEVSKAGINAGVAIEGIKAGQ